jgi:hypothetical protein
MKNTDITNMTVEALDIEELERRLELAAQSADCSCCGSNDGGCTSNQVKTATTTKPGNC